MAVATPSFVKLAVYAADCEPVHLRKQYSPTAMSSSAVRKPAIMSKPVRNPENSNSVPVGERLQKILAQAGIASRRKAEELIVEGRVQVNGKVVTELGTRASLDRDHIRVAGKLLHARE